MANVPPDCGHNESAAQMADKVDSLYGNYLAGGPDAAYKCLKNAYDSADVCTRDAYFQQVAADLQATGHLPNIAVGWLKVEKSRLDAGGDGVIDKQDIIQAEVNGGLDAIFGKVMLTNTPSPGDNKTFFDQVAHTKKDWDVNPDGIEDADLRKYGRQEHRAERRENNKEQTNDAASPLFDNNGELLNALDVGRHGRSNGFISRHEMKQFLEHYKETPGVGVYTDQNANYVNELLHGKIGRVDDHPMHGFSVARLQRRAGVTEADMQAQPVQTAIIKDVVPTPKVDDNCVVVPPTDKVTVKTPAQTTPEMSDAAIDLQLHKTVETLSIVQPGQGYDYVAANLLDIHHTHRSAEEVQNIQSLGLAIKGVNGDYSTLHLRAGVVLPVAANLELLMKDSPALAASVQKLRDKIAHPPKAADSQQITQLSDNGECGEIDE